MASKLMDLVYWRNMRKTGVVFTGLVIALASVFQLSVITVLSHICLGAMCVTFPLRLYYKLLELLGWNTGVHPFQSYLDNDGSLTDKDTVMLVEEVVLLIAFAVTEFKRLLFIDSTIDSIKFVVLLYLLTCVGVQVNGLTLVITGEFFNRNWSQPLACEDNAAVIVIFSIPLLYKKQQVRIRKVVRAVKAFVKKVNSLCLSLYESVRPPPAPEATSKSVVAPAPKQKAKSK